MASPPFALRRVIRLRRNRSAADTAHRAGIVRAIGVRRVVVEIAGIGIRLGVVLHRVARRLAVALRETGRGRGEREKDSECEYSCFTFHGDLRRCIKIYRFDGLPKTTAVVVARAEVARSNWCAPRQKIEVRRSGAVTLA